MRGGFVDQGQRQWAKVGWRNSFFLRTNSKYLRWFHIIWGLSQIYWNIVKWDKWCFNPMWSQFARLTGNVCSALQKINGTEENNSDSPSGIELQKNVSLNDEAVSRTFLSWDLRRESMPQKCLSFHMYRSLVSCVQPGDRSNVTEVVALSILQHFSSKNI